MAQVNRNYAYIRDIEGLTVWEKLRNIRNFLVDREQSLELAILAENDFLDNINNKTDFEKKEYEIKKNFSKSLIEDCKREIDFLKKYELSLKEEAYKYRIDGASDEEMYEINFINESRIRLLNKATAELLTQGVMSVDTFQTCIKEPTILIKLSDLGLINSNIIDTVLKSADLLPISKNNKIELVSSNIGYLE